MTNNQNQKNKDEIWLARGGSFSLNSRMFAVAFLSPYVLFLVMKLGLSPTATMLLGPILTTFIFYVMDQTSNYFTLKYLDKLDKKNGTDNSDNNRKDDL